MEQSVEVTKEEIGKRVRKQRLKHGWTDEELGQMIGLSGSSLNNKERGVRDFTWNEIIRLCDVFKITMDELIRGVKPENLPAHRKTGLCNDAVNNLKDFFESHSMEMVKGLNLALCYPYVLDALARYMSFRPREKGYFLSEVKTNDKEPLIECHMSQSLYFSVLGQNLLHVLNDARRRDYDTRRRYEAVEDFTLADEINEAVKLAEPSEYDQDDADPDRT